jgi:hypothetical protein
MSSAQAWQIVLTGMKAANAGWITRAEAEHLLNEYFDRIEIAVAIEPGVRVIRIT